MPDKQQVQRAVQNRYKIHLGPQHLFLPISPPPHDSAQPPIQTTLLTTKSFIQTRHDKMQFTAVVVAALACASSVSALIPSFTSFGSPLGGGMSGCGNQSGLVNIAALTQNICGSPAGPSAMSCGNQAGVLNVGLLSSNNCGGSLYARSDVSLPSFSANHPCHGKMSSETNLSLICISSSSHSHLKDSKNADHTA